MSGNARPGQGAGGPGGTPLVFVRGIAGLEWPAIPTRAGGQALALQGQLADSEWLPAAELRRRQLLQLDALACHAREHSPFWRERLDAAGFRPGTDDEQWFRRLPILPRAQLQAEPIFTAAPSAHGAVRESRTSGSTAAPMFCRSTDLAQLMWNAFTLRDSLWRGRDFSGRFASVRVGFGMASHPNWGAPIADVCTTGASVTIGASEEVDRQLDWLAQFDPHYLLSHASNLRALALRSLERGLHLPALRAVESFSESVPPDLRELTAEAWDTEFADMYSANECGYLALQCPAHAHYHVQAEGALVEVIDEHGEDCAAGEVGRVIVTPLHNFAMPLLRYELGDYAVPGDSCPCGRGLPVLQRIMGRTRNMARLPGGGTFWPGVPLRALTGVAPIRRFQLVQTRLDTIELRVVMDRDPDGAECAALANAVRTRLRREFEVPVVRVPALERSAGGKFEDFICLLP